MRNFDELARAVVAYVETHGKITNRECRQHFGMSYDEATRLLNTLCASGVLQCVGVTAGTKYILPAHDEGTPGKKE